MTRFSAKGAKARRRDPHENPHLVSALLARGVKRRHGVAASGAPTQAPDPADLRAFVLQTPCIAAGTDGHTCEGAVSAVGRRRPIPLCAAACLQLAELTGPFKGTTRAARRDWARRCWDAVDVMSNPKDEAEADRLEMIGLGHMSESEGQRRWVPGISTAGAAVRS